MKLDDLTPEEAGAFRDALYRMMTGTVPVEADEAAIYRVVEASRRAGAAALPCYESWVAEHSQGDCLQDGGTYRCPRCMAQQGVQG